MRAIEIRGGFGLDNLALVERPRPQPAAGELLLRVKAASLNYRDLLTVTGAYNPRQPLPIVPCSDCAAEVVEVGPGVERFSVGARVMPLFAPRWIAGRPTHARLRTTLGGPLDGVLREHMTISAESVVAVPSHLDDRQAATLPCAALTAWSALFEQGRLTAGETVLVLGSGGVALFALQLAKLAGARVIAVSSSDRKRERLRELGAEQTLSYLEEPSWGKRVRELSGGGGVDHVIEVGGAGTLEQSLKAVRIGGTISLIGVLSGAKAPLDIRPLTMKAVRVQGLVVGDRESFERMNRAIAAAELEPVIDRSFPLEQTTEALRTMERGEHIGKICIEL